MFDIGFWEISLIGVIALLVVGPERLPGMARNVGFWVGRIRRYVNQVKSDVEREINAEELKQAIRKPEGLEDLYDVVDSTRESVEEARNVLRDAETAVHDDAPASAGEQPVVAVTDDAPALAEPTPAPRTSTWSDAVAHELARDGDAESAPAAETAAGAGPSQQDGAPDTRTDDERRH